MALAGAFRNLGGPEIPFGFGKLSRPHFTGTPATCIIAPMRLFVSLWLLLSIALFAQEAKKGPNPFENPKNLKLLQPANARQAMQAFRAALGVQCVYCHVQGDFASDDNPKKNVARMMITMARQINMNFPDGKQHVTCFTCHRGAEEPLIEAPATAEAPKEAPK